MPNRSGRIWLRTRNVDEGGKSFAQFCIGNSDSYIAPEDADRIFDVFYTRGSHGGTGLGLAISQKIIAAHGGRIWVKSERGYGTELYFTLPASVKGVQASVTTVMSEYQASSDRERKGTLRMLVVDDEDVWLEAIESHTAGLGDWKFEQLSIVKAKNADEAVDAIRTSAPDIVLTDIELGGLGPEGFQLIEDLRKIAPKSLIYGNSNRDFKGDYKRAVAAGANGFFRKPLSRDSLKEIVSNCMR